MAQEFMNERVHRVGKNGSGIRSKKGVLKRRSRGKQGSHGEDTAVRASDRNWSYALQQLGEVAATRGTGSFVFPFYYIISDDRYRQFYTYRLRWVHKEHILGFYIRFSF